MLGGPGGGDHCQEQGGDQGGDQGHRGGGTPFHTKVFVALIFKVETLIYSMTLLLMYDQFPDLIIMNMVFFYTGPPLKS